SKNGFKGWSMSENDLQQRVTTGIEREHRRIRRNTVITNLVIFAILAPIFWLSFLGNYSLAPLVLVLFTLAWFTTILSQFNTFFKELPGKNRQLRERIEQLERLDEQIRLKEAQLAEKPKRNQHLRLSDEGELIPVDESDDDSLKR